jgi:hypothetical protein
LAHWIYEKLVRSEKEKLQSSDEKSSFVRIRCQREYDQQRIEKNDDDDNDDVEKERTETLEKADSAL